MRENTEEVEGEESVGGRREYKRKLWHTLGVVGYGCETEEYFFFFVCFLYFMLPIIFCVFIYLMPYGSGWGRVEGEYVVGVSYALCLGAP